MIKIILLLALLIVSAYEFIVFTILKGNPDFRIEMFEKIKSIDSDFFDKIVDNNLTKSFIVLVIILLLFFI